MDVFMTRLLPIQVGLKKRNLSDIPTCPVENKIDLMPDKHPSNEQGVNPFLS
jgi:hypothetical protein